MNKIDKKILFFDIDGTVLSEKTNSVPPSALDAIKKARENGHIAIINTGRPFSTVDQMIKDIGFDGFVCGCGTNIYFNNKEIYHQTLDLNTRQKIMQLAYLHKVDCLLEGKHGTYFKSELLHPFMTFLKDKYTKEGIPYIINHREKQKEKEENKIETIDMKITGHYRFEYNKKLQELIYSKE